MNSTGEFLNVRKDRQDLIDEFIDYLKDSDDAEDSISKALTPIFSFVRKSESLEDMLNEYHSLYPKMNTSDFNSLINISKVISDVLGWDSTSADEESQNNIFNKDPEEINFDDVLEALKLSPQKAVEYFKKKGLSIASNTEERLEAIKKNAFTVTGVLKLDILNDFKEMILKAIDEGITKNDFQKELKDRLATKGWYRKDENGEITKPHRLGIIFRTNLQDAYMQGRWDQMQESKDVIPYIRCFSTRDSNTTDPCKFLHGKVFRKDDKTYLKYFRAPGHFQCRRSEVPVTTSKLERNKWTVTKASDIPKKHRNTKEFQRDENGYQPDLSKYDEQLVEYFEEDSDE